MKKRLYALVLAAVILVGALLISPAKKPAEPVFQQHREWPQESEEVQKLQKKGVFASHLPILVIHTDGRTVPGYLRTDDKELPCDWEIFWNEEGVNQLSDEPSQTGQLGLSIRGNSSRDYPKKQYTVKTVNEEGLPADVALLGMPAESTWVLNGSWIDHSLLRNYLLCNLSGQVMDYAPRCRLCEVFLTDKKGAPKYFGVCTLEEKIKVSEARLNLPQVSPEHEETSFLMQMNSKIDNLRIYHLKPDGVNTYSFDLEYPPLDELDQESLHYIQQQMLVFEKTLYDALRSGDWDDVNRMVDLGSFADYYIINEFFQNLDAGTRSTYLWQAPGGKVAIGPVWDFDGTFNNFQDVESRTDYLKVKSTVYYRCLFQDPAFVELCLQRYETLRQGVLSEERLVEAIDSAAAYVGSAAHRNAARWYKGDDSLFEKDVAGMKDFVRERGAWMDENLARLCTPIR